MKYRLFNFFLVFGVFMFLFKLVFPDGEMSWLQIFLHSGMESLAATLIYSLLTNKLDKRGSSRSFT